MYKEVWKVIENFENYEVSTIGNVRNTETGDLIKISFKEQGYYCYLKKGGSNKPYMRTVHILMAAVFVDNPNNYNYVVHVDGIRRNNFAFNLKYVNHSRAAKAIEIKPFIPNKSYKPKKSPDYAAIDKILRLDKAHRESLDPFKKKPTEDQ